MIRLELLLGLVVLGSLLLRLVEEISSDEGAVRNLPKAPWILDGLFFPLAGSVAWLVAGRTVTAPAGRYGRAVRDFPEYDRPGLVAASDPKEDFLHRVRERAEERRRSHRESGRTDGTGSGPNREDPGSEPQV